MGQTEILNFFKEKHDQGNFSFFTIAELSKTLCEPAAWKSVNQLVKFDLLEVILIEIVPPRRGFRYKESKNGSRTN